MNDKTDRTTVGGEAGPSPRQGDEVAVEAEGAGARTGWRRFRRGGRTLALTMGAVLAVATGAAAATGAIPVGSVIPGGEPTGAPEYRLSVDETILATGTTPVAGPWRLSAYRSEGTVAEGELVEPDGLHCLRILLSEPPLGSAARGAGFCGEQAESGFKRSVLPVGDASGREEVIVFGQAPEHATAVELIAGDKRVGTAEMYDGPEGYPGDLWVIAASPRPDPAEVRWIAGGHVSPGLGADLRGQRLVPAKRAITSAERSKPQQQP